MDFLHTDFWGGSERIAIINLDRQANVMLLDDLNFAAYKHGHSFRYQGGWASRLRVRLQPLHHGHWHVIVDLGGGTGVVRASIKVVEIDPQPNLF